MELSLDSLKINNNHSCLQINIDAIENSPVEKVPDPLYTPLGQETEMAYTEKPLIVRTIKKETLRSTDDRWSKGFIGMQGITGYSGYTGYSGVTGCAGIGSGATGVKGSGATGISRSRITPMQRAVSENILETSDGFIIKTRVGKMIRPSEGQSIIA